MSTTSKQAISPSIEHLDVSELLTLEKKVALGQICDLYEGSLKRGDRRIKVAVKELRVMPQVQENRFQKLFLQSVNTWNGLNHPNIAPLLGYSTEPESGPRFVLLWYENGNLEQCLQSNRDVNRPRLLLDILQGMGYLQSCGMVHGDLKSLNVLVDKDGRACLCDFGATRFLEADTGLTTNNQNTAAARRFLSPERLQIDGPPTIPSDIWAFGCIVIEVIACQRPYEHIISDHQVYTAIVKGKLPLNPNYDTSTPPGRFFWDFIKRCWKYDPKRRPTIDQLVDHIGRSFPLDIHSQPEINNPRSNWSLIKEATSKIARFPPGIRRSYSTPSGKLLTSRGR